MFVHRWPGDERTVLALHGWGGSHATFAGMAACSSATMIAPDLPGYGRSPAPWVWTLDAIVEELVDALPTNRRLTVLGGCSGAVIALMLAQRLPAQIDRLVLVEPFAFMPWYFRLFLAPVIGPVSYWSAFRNPFGRWLTNARLRANRRGETDLTASPRTTSPAINRRWLRMLADCPLPEAFADVAVPVTLACGSNTFGAVRQSVEDFVRVWPSARVHTLPGAGHMALQETPAAVAALLEG